MDNDDLTPLQKAVGIGCYVVLSYALYWPMLWAARAGSAWHASRHPNFSCDWGEPGFWVVMWLIAPITMPLMAFVAVGYWVLAPVVDFVAHWCW
jgi:hypothetical protein